MTQTSKPVLEVSNLAVRFKTRNGIVNAIKDVSLSLGRGEILGLVGESGSGKSVSAYAMLGLLESSGEVTEGAAIFGDVDLISMSPRELRRLRGSTVSMIFQNARAALNPIRKVGEQLVDVIRAHKPMSRKQAEHEALAMLQAVGLTDPARRYHAFPFEMSGGMCQRIMIALALVCSPKLLIADEPTTGLDVTTQATIMDLVAGLCRTKGMAAIFITHDLALAADYSDRIAVMQAGRVVEQGQADDILTSPQHPYTRALIAATPRQDSTLASLAALPEASLPEPSAMTGETVP